MKWSLTKSEESQWHETGFVLVPNPVDPVIIAELQTAIADVEVEWRSRVWEPGSHPLAMQFAMLGNTAFILPEHPEFVRTASALLNVEQVFVGCCSVGNTIEVEASDGRKRQQLQWHSTPGWEGEFGTPFEQVAFRIALDEHDSETGGLRLLPGTHRVPKSIAHERVLAGLRRMPDYYEFNGMHFGSHPDQVELFLKPSQLLIWTPNVWHATGEMLSTKPRRAITWLYFPPGGRFRDRAALQRHFPTMIQDWPAARKELWGIQS